jgi:hypothetical protein
VREELSDDLVQPGLVTVGEVVEISSVRDVVISKRLSKKEQASPRVSAASLALARTED